MNRDYEFGRGREESDRERWEREHRDDSRRWTGEHRFGEYPGRGEAERRFGGPPWGNEGYTGGRAPGGLNWIEQRRERMGRGPKNYQRSDERIREDVCDVLSDHDWLDASDVEIQVKAGEVTITGFVGDRSSKRLVEDLSEQVRGVKDVHNQLRVRQDARRSPSGGAASS